MSHNIKKKADNFIKKYQLSVVDYETLSKTIADMGYTLIEFNGICSDPDVESVICNLGLKNTTLQARGFTYTSQDHRMVFVNEDLNKEEKLLVLAHEIGHIVCEHFTAVPIIGKDVKEEYEANEFSHHLLNQSGLQKMSAYIHRHRVATVTVMVAVCVLLVSAMMYFLLRDKETYANDLYITSTGERYHKKNCIFVKDKTNVERLTQEVFESGEYSPCEICLPNQD